MQGQKAARPSNTNNTGAVSLPVLSKIIRRIANMALSENSAESIAVKLYSTAKTGLVRFLPSRGWQIRTLSGWRSTGHQAPHPFRIPSPYFSQTAGECTLIPRYTRPDMGRIWSDENRFRTWLAVEVAATETLAEAGMVPKNAARAIRERADFNLDRIAEIEAEVRHDVIAFTTAVAEIVGPHARWFHYGLTSNDVVDTSQALLI